MKDCKFNAFVILVDITALYTFSEINADGCDQVSSFTVKYTIPINNMGFFF